MRILIVGKTHMRAQICVGGLALESNKSIRLLTASGDNQPVDSPFEIGDVWDIESHPRTDVIPPHMEDILVSRARFIEKQNDLRQLLIHRISPWRGGPHHLFGGLVRATGSGSGYVSHTAGVPGRSIGYWLPDRSLVRVLENGKERFQYPGERGIRNLPYVGCALSVPQIVEGTLVRVSLARWWSPDGEFEQRCYLQLSGWFL